MLYLQFHIVWNPAYNILLGRPFDILVESIIHNFKNESQMVTIYDLNTGKTATVPTFVYGPMHLSPLTGFLQLKDLIGDQGDVALVVEYDNEFPVSSMITTFSELLPSPSPTDISLCYFEACDTNQCTNMRMSKDHSCEHSLWSTCTISSIDTPLATFVAKKKYKLVARKVQLILDTLPLHFHIERNITGDLLADLPTLSRHPPPFAPTVAIPRSDTWKWMNYTPPNFYSLPNMIYSNTLSHFRMKGSLGMILSMVTFAKTSSLPSKFPL